MNNSQTQADIHAKGFDLTGTSKSIYEINGEYKQIKVNGVRQLDNATLTLGNYARVRQANVPIITKDEVMRALLARDVEKLRCYSQIFYRTNGIYHRTCDYFAYLYRYDWYVTPDYPLDAEIPEDRMLKDFYKALTYFDNSHIKKICGEIALNVILDGAYYGYIVPSKIGVILQQLPVRYCRSRYKSNGMPAVEFNMQYFDTIANPQQRIRILNLFPDEFKKGYLLYKQGKLKADFNGDTGCWYLLTPGLCVKFAFDNYDMPLFVHAIPTLLDLDAAQDLDRRKQMQKLLKILIQKLPRDKNGDLIFDNDEARDIHNNAVQMLRNAVGVDILTTFADIDAVDLADKNTTATTDDLAKVERTVYNAFGISRNLFNTDGNMSLEKSILNDEASLRTLILQFAEFFNALAAGHSSARKKYSFRFYMLETTQYNYKDLAKMYKEQTQMGFAKMLPQIALGHSQSFVLNSMRFENQVLNMNEFMVPPALSSTMSGSNNSDNSNKSNTGKNDKSIEAQVSSGEAGRPAKPDDEKSDKTIQNIESQN